MFFNIPRGAESAPHFYVFLWTLWKKEKQKEGKSYFA